MAEKNGVAERVAGAFEKELKRRIEWSERVKDLGWKISDEMVEKITPVIM